MQNSILPVFNGNMHRSARKDLFSESTVGCIKADASHRRETGKKACGTQSLVLQNMLLDVRLVGHRNPPASFIHFYRPNPCSCKGTNRTCAEPPILFECSMQPPLGKNVQQSSILPMLSQYFPMSTSSTPCKKCGHHGLLYCCLRLERGSALLYQG